jgi:hypothetical protein
VRVPADDAGAEQVQLGDGRFTLTERRQVQPRLLTVAAVPTS